jgi:hypothetical protein
MHQSTGVRAGILVIDNPRFRNLYALPLGNNRNPGRIPKFWPAHAIGDA